MNNKQYQYRSILEIVSGGYPGEEYGPQGATTGWIGTTQLSGSRTSVYYFRDSNSLSNANSSKVEVTVKDTWVATIANNNTLNIVADTDIISITRTGIQGNPNYGSNATRDIIIRRYAGGPILARWNSLNIADTGAISNGVNLPAYSFSLAPGEDASQSTLYVLNCVTGHEGDTLPSTNVDAMYMGVQFRNILPKDYRPGAIIGPEGQWLSHNRSGGNRAIYNGSSWIELRTYDGGSGTDNPPSISNGSSWKNQRNIGIGG